MRPRSSSTRCPRLIDAVVLVDRRVRRPEGRDLDDLVAEAYVREMKAPADQAAVAKQLLHLVRMRVGGDVEVLRMQAEQQVAHGAAHEKCLVASLFQPVQDLQRIRGDVGTRDRVLFARHDARGASASSMISAGELLSFNSSGPSVRVKNLSRVKRPV